MGKELLAEVRVGMAVYDRNEKQIGVVERVHLGEVSANEAAQGLQRETISDEGRQEPGPAGLAEALEDSFDPARELDNVVRNQMLGQGFIEVAGSELKDSERVISPDKIAQVVDGRVILSIASGEL